MYKISILLYNKFKWGKSSWTGGTWPSLAAASLQLAVKLQGDQIRH